MLICLRLILHTAIPFRGLSEALKILDLGKYYNIKRMPSYSTTRRWVNRLGLYHLEKEKEKADDWCYIVDNSMRIENRKLCLILGMRLSKIKREGYLKFEDVEILELGLIQGKTTQGVLQLLESAIEKTGEPLEICSDQGPDVVPAIKQVISRYSKIKYVPDVIHATANILKRVFEKNTRWVEFSKKVGEAKNKLKQSLQSELCPPQIRGKSRFLNCGVVIDWAVKIIELMERAECEDAVKIKLGWLFEYRNDLIEMQEMIRIVGLINELVRFQRIDATTWLMAKELLQEEAITERGRELSQEILRFLNKISDIAGEHFLVGSSEIIESAFGKLKTLDRECGNSGFTSSILGIGACFGKLDYDTVGKAMRDVSDKAVEEWKIKNIGESQQNKRRRQLKNKKLEDLNQKLTRIIEGRKAVA
jgi:hypothetical protein